MFFCSLFVQAELVWMYDDLFAVEKCENVLKMFAEFVTQMDRRRVRVMNKRMQSPFALNRVVLL